MGASQCGRSTPEAAPAPAQKEGCPYLLMMKQMQGLEKRPQKLRLDILEPRNHGEDYASYSKLFLSLDFPQLKADIAQMLKTSQGWWPADYGHYGPFMFRMAWHAAGTYRASDGRGGANTGNQRFFPLDSWVDNGQLDKARRLLWGVKQKYGKKLSWADLMILVANVALEDMGLKTFGFGGGRVDCWHCEEDVYWGHEGSFGIAARKPKQLEKPLSATELELIYVNPEGPQGVPDPMLAVAQVRETFARMSMNDEETVALIAGGHTFGKAHGAAPPSEHVGARPSDAPIEAQGLGWISTYKSGKGPDTITSGLEGAWTANPTTWDNGYFHNLFTYDWELYRCQGGAQQWRPRGGAGANDVVDAHDPGKRTHPIMFTTDIALIKDQTYLEISKAFHADFAKFTEVFRRAWYKLTHRDMGPVERCLGSEVAPAQLWQDPVPKGRKFTPTPAHKKALLESGVSPRDLVRIAWASACTYRHTDFRGGSNGARVRLAPQNAWAVNGNVKDLLPKYEAVQSQFASDDISLADLIVLGGCVAVEAAAIAASDGRVPLEVPFASGRGDATAKDIDVASFAVLEPTSDAFRNYNANPYQMVDRAHLLTLSAAEMAVLVAGLRSLGANAPQVGDLGVLTKSPGKLSNDFFVNLLDMGTAWRRTEAGLFEGIDRASGEQKWTASEVDLAFGSNPELRAIAERYACADAGEDFVRDFGRAFGKVMSLGTF